MRKEGIEVVDEIHDELKREDERRLRDVPVAVDRRKSAKKGKRTSKNDNNEETKNVESSGKANPLYLTTSSASATFDPVRMYLKEIGKVSLLTADEEVRLAKRIEAGLTAGKKLEENEIDDSTKKSSLKAIIRDGEMASRELVEANLRLVVSIAKRYARKS